MACMARLSFAVGMGPVICHLSFVIVICHLHSSMGWHFDCPVIAIRICIDSIAFGVAMLVLFCCCCALINNMYVVAGASKEEATRIASTECHCRPC